MAFDYSLRFTGQDDLSGVLGKVKKEIKDMGKEASNVELVDKAMGKIITSSGKLNTKVKQTSALLAEMKFDGDHNAAQFLNIAKAAGNAKDAISDTQAMIKFFADDRRWLNTTVQGFQALAGIGSIAAGGMSLLGIESENATKAIQGCQQALAILNGITTVANLLDKEGYLMTAKKILGLKAEATAIDKATEAQTRNNIAVKANPYVMLAMVVAAAAVAVYNFAKNNDEATRAQEDLNKASENYKKNQESQNQTVAESIIKFKTLQSQWNSLGDDLNAKKKFVDDNKTAFKDLGLKVDGVTSAESVFGKNANAIIAAMKARAKATAAYATMVDNLKDQYVKLGEIERKIKNGEQFSQSDLADIGILNPDAMAGLREDFTFSALFGGQKYYTVIGKSAADLIMDSATITLENRADELNKPFELAAKRAQEEAASVPFYSPGSSSSGSGSSGSGRSGSGRSGKGSSNSPTNNDKKGLINDYEKKIQELKEKVNSAETEKDLAEAIKNLNDKEKEFTDFKIRVGLEVDPKIKDKERAEKKAKEQAETLYKNFQDTMSEVAGRYSISTFDKLIGDNPFNTNSLEGLKRMIDATENSLKGLYDLKKEFEDEGKTGSDAYQQIIDKIKELEEELAKLGIIVIETKTKSEKTAKIEDTFNKIGEAAGYTGQMFSSLGQMAEDNGLKAAGIVAETIAQLALGYAKATVAAADLGPWAWISFGLAGAAQLAAMIAQIHSLSGYASGGIISGGSSYGDMVMARVNAGEMVLNRRQQANLFRTIESGSIGAGNTVLVPEFKIKGSDLYGTLRNFSKSVGKTGKVTGIR